MGFSVLTMFMSVIGAQATMLPQRRDAFDPNLLMQNYMGMRTDQSSFGSFHPNDLVKTIQNYFQQDGTRTHPNGQWGFSIYNPNDAIKQYGGEPNLSGTLGPEEGETKMAEIHENQKPFDKMTGFNPDQINQMLLNSIEKDGFSANVINKQLMQEVKSTQQEEASSSPGKSDSTNAPSIQSGGMGFDANQLNAQLLSGLEYDPNSAMPSMSNFKGNTGSTSMMTLSTSTGSLNGVVSSSTMSTTASSQGVAQGNGNKSGNLDGNLTGGHGLNNLAGNLGSTNLAGGLSGNTMATGNSAGSNGANSSGSFSKPLSGTSAVGANMGAANFNAGGLEQGGTSSSNTGVMPASNGVGSNTGVGVNAGGLEQGSASGQSMGGQATGYTGQTGANLSSGNTGMIPASNGVGSNTSAGFNAGGLGPNGSSNNGQGNPPDVQAGRDDLKQTEVGIPTPSGIGEIGGRLS